MTKRSRWTALAAAAVLAAVAIAADLPRPAPAFEISMNDGKPLALASLKGKAVVLAFILTTCPHCQHTTGILKQLQADYGPRGLQIVAAAIEANAQADVPGFVQRFQPGFPVGFASYDQAVAFLQHSPNLALLVPAIVFLDRQGTIRAEYEGNARFFSEDQQEHNLRAEIEKLLAPGTKKPASASKTASK